MTALEVLTVGHSVHTWERFSQLLVRAGATAVADVRSVPYSRHTPHFSQAELKGLLRSAGIAYSFLGNELGGRPKSPDLFKDGVANYEAMAQTPNFLAGVDRIISGSTRHLIALMCSEQDPLDCHRCLLVGRYLASVAVNVGHILVDGKIVGHEEIEERLLKSERLGSADLFMPRSERLKEAYRERSMKVAFADNSAPVSEQMRSP